MWTQVEKAEFSFQSICSHRNGRPTSNAPVLLALDMKQMQHPCRDQRLLSIIFTALSFILLLVVVSFGSGTAAATVVIIIIITIIIVLQRRRHCHHQHRQRQWISVINVLALVERSENNPCNSDSVGLTGPGSQDRPRKLEGLSNLIAHAELKG